MKKALIIFAILFLLTLAIPVAAAITNPPEKSTAELATLFSGENSAVNSPSSSR